MSEAATYAYDDNERLALVLPIGGDGSQYYYDPVGNLTRKGADDIQLGFKRQARWDIKHPR